MTDEQSEELMREVKRHGGLSLSLFRTMFGDVDIVAELMEGRIPEPWKSELLPRIDRLSFVQYQLGKMQEQLDRIEAKLDAPARSQ